MYKICAKRKKKRDEKSFSNKFETKYRICDKNTVY